jgi:hypothetical protein
MKVRSAIRGGPWERLMSRSRNEYWRKNPALELVFWAVLTVGFFCFVIAAITAGKINLGHGAKGVPITAANDPLAFWAIIGLLSILGIAAPAYNLRRIIRTRQSQRDTEDSEPPATQS